ncbi:hypothetical protein KL925_001367 [Ogataea polymorpha]|nr:hypothetical protein KL936_001366 [Ogataea polymorpha]KAG7928067.1 hypothetical protein KL925_001367 [Ogataea polymorpha]
MSELANDLLRKKARQLDHSSSFSSETADSLGQLPNSRRKESRISTNKVPDITSFFPHLEVFTNNDGYLFQTYYRPPRQKDSDSSVILVMHHGAGSSGATFAKLAPAIEKQCEMQSISSVPGVFTFDMRGHGRTALLNSSSEENSKLSIDNLCDDFRFLLQWFHEKYIPEGPPPSYFLVGHSLGGSILTKVISDDVNNSACLKKNLGQLVSGLVMIDIVEDTAIKSLSAMNSYLNTIPKQFPSIEDAIRWHIDSNLLHNVDSSLISVPSLFTRTDEGHYKWIIDLRKTEPFWHDWFEGLSKRFVSIPDRISKLLILANNDYLDKDLMIGQMQGKYQLVVFHNNQLKHANTLTTATQSIPSQDASDLGHFVHEDIPLKVAASLVDFVERNDYKFASTNSSLSNFKSQADLLSAYNAKWGVSH